MADPLVEWASNAGRFGPGNFTDHSTADVVPALLVGVLFVATHLWLRVRRALTRGPASDLLRASRQAIGGGVLRLLPLVFAIQMLVLYCMETSEQIAVVGHPLGGMIWLGGPVLQPSSAVFGHAARKPRSSFFVTSENAPHRS
jgi:hypothetical protein